jgi:hypothetical protein
VGKIFGGAHLYTQKKITAFNEKYLKEKLV